MNVNVRCLFVYATLLLTGFAPGCSAQRDVPDVGQVTGRITVRGEPFSGVIVSFMPDNGRAANGVTDADGRYKLIYLDGVSGSKIGPNTVTFLTPTGGSPSHPIPAKYLHNSPLKADVQKGKNTFDFDLEPDAGKGKASRPAVPVAD